MDPVEIIRQFCPPGSRAFRILIDHGERVSEKALAVARRLARLEPDLEFIRQAALLHDLGMVLTRSPGLGCRGKHPYIRHGVLGAEILETLGYPAHARVCETHVGVGITCGEIRKRGLPLPERDMVPRSLEEQIVCYADKFYSKNGGSGGVEKPVPRILEGLSRLGPGKAEIFSAWLERFGP